MKIKKAIALMIGLVLIVSLALPGTLAVSADQSAATGTLTLAGGTVSSVPEEKEASTTEGTEAPTTEGTEASTTEGTEASTTEGTEASTEGTDQTTAPTETEPSAPTEVTEPSETTLPTEPETPKFDPQAVYDRLMAAETLEEFNKLFDALSEEEVESFRTWLTENGLVEALKAHLKAIMPEEVLPETVVFTDAGPFLPAVRVASDASFTTQTARRAARVATDADGSDTDGLKLKKTAVANGDGTYTITLESYTTGSVTTTTTTKPVDIVLVLDQSTSMSYSFSDQEIYDYDGTDSRSRQYAMKQAVYSFINNVKKQYSADSDHRIAIVKFGAQASDVCGWTFVDENGADSLRSGVKGMTIEFDTGTQTQTGMRRANELIDTGYKYSGNNTDRQKVVILFTDGIPGNTGFDTNVANSAVSYAKRIKDAGATVYTIGIFNGANVNEMHGTSSSFHDRSNGTVDSHWCDYAPWDGTPTKAVSAVAGNRFLNLVSSNFKDATSVGLEAYNHHYYYYYSGWKITENFTRSASNYYLTASDASSLNDIFKTISENISTPSIELGSETVVKDIVAECFEIPENAKDIKVYTAAATANALNNPDENSSWKDRTPGSGITPTVSEDGRTVSVTGFDYTENFVASTGRGENSDFYGKKLIIEFTVKAKSGFLGGNNVKTNAGAGVYANGSSETPLKSFNEPSVNVPIDKVTVTAKDKNVYLLNGVTADQLKSDATVKVGGVPLDLSKASNANEPYGLEKWQTEYVNITVTVTDEDGKEIPTDGLTKDTKYNITVKVTPKDSPRSESSGDAATEETGSGDGNINVFKPELTFKDSTAYYGDAVPDLDGNCTKTEWKHGNMLSTAVTMTGDMPALDITSTPDADKISSGKINTLQDIGVDVTVKINGTDVTDKTKFLHTDCTGQTCTLPGGKEFLIHVKSCTLTIEKKGWDEIDENQSFVFNVTDAAGNSVTRVVIAMVDMGSQTSNSVTIKGLKAGTYAVTEDTGWSWRYEPEKNGQTVTLTANTDNGTVTFTNERKIDKWLGGDAYNQNKFESGNSN